MRVRKEGLEGKKEAKVVSEAMLEEYMGMVCVVRAKKEEQRMRQQKDLLCYCDHDVC